MEEDCVQSHNNVPLRHLSVRMDFVGSDREEFWDHSQFLYSHDICHPLCLLRALHIHVPSERSEFSGCSESNGKNDRVSGFHEEMA